VIVESIATIMIVILGVNMTRIAVMERFVVREVVLRELAVIRVIVNAANIVLTMNVKRDARKVRHVVPMRFVVMTFVWRGTAVPRMIASVKKHVKIMYVLNQAILMERRVPLMIKAQGMSPMIRSIWLPDLLL
jgi:hypothetical protein